MVSIVTPAYNAEKYLEATITSILEQTYTDWELLIVDDCSTDETLSIAKKYEERDSRIHVIKLDINGGVAHARNVALLYCRGDYIAFLDSDDMWLPSKLEQQLDFMLKQGCVLSYTDYQLFDSNTGALGKVIKAPSIMSSKDIIKNTAIGCLTVMVNRQLSGNFEMPLLKHTEDNCTWYEILKRTNSKAYKLPKVLSLYRTGNTSLTQHKGGAAKKQWQTYRSYYKFSIIKSAYYFSIYAINAIIRHYL